MVALERRDADAAPACALGDTRRVETGAQLQVDVQPGVNSPEPREVRDGRQCLSQRLSLPPVLVAHAANVPVQVAESRKRYGPIVELRQYTLRPGGRERLIALFEQRFIEPQEAVGMDVIGQYRDLDDSDRFVWLRGFPEMEARHAAPQAFYGGPLWQQHRAEANATMVESDNVLLLRPVQPAPGFVLDRADRPPFGAAERAGTPLLATILPLATQPGAEVLDWFAGTLAPTLIGRGASILATFVTEERANDFPALPVREGEHVFVWFSRFDDQSAYEAGHPATT